MSKPRDPVVAVLQYFQTADLALAQQALALAQLTLRNRLPKSGQANLKPRPVPKPKVAPVAGAVGE